MTCLRGEVDADIISVDIGSPYRSAADRYEVPCSVCGRILFVNKDAKRDLDRAIEHDLDNTIKCFECQEDYDRLVFE